MGIQSLLLSSTPTLMGGMRLGPLRRSRSVRVCAFFVFLISGAALYMYSLVADFVCNVHTLASYKTSQDTHAANPLGTDVHALAFDLS